MRPSVAAAWPAFCSLFEGRCWWMYLDTKRLVTTGVGFLIDTIKQAQALPWTRVSDGKPATADEIEREWRRVKALTSLAPKGGYAYRASARLRLPEAEIDRTLMQTTNRFWAGLKDRWPDIEAWPADAQLAALDLAWQNGYAFTDLKSNGKHVWPNTRAAFKAQDWTKAASAVPGSGARHDRRVKLFRNAAAVVKFKLDRDVLWDKKTPTAPTPIPPVKSINGAKVTHFADLPLDTAYNVPGGRDRALWQGATYAKNPLTGAEYLFQMQADATGPGDIEDIWVHRYSLKGDVLTYMDSMLCKRFGHVQTQHVRISALGNTRIWLGVEVYVNNKSTGKKVWRLLYTPGTVKRSDKHQYIYTGRGSAAPISSPKGWIVLRRPAADGSENYEWHKEAELLKWRSTVDRPKPVRVVNAPRTDGTYQSACADGSSIFRINGATEDDSVISQFTTEGRIGRLNVTSAAPASAGNVTSEEPEAVFYLRGELTFGKRFNSVARRVVSYFTVEY